MQCIQTVAVGLALLHGQAVQDSQACNGRPGTAGWDHTPEMDEFFPRSQPPQSREMQGGGEGQSTQRDEQRGGLRYRSNITVIYLMSLKIQILLNLEAKKRGFNLEKNSLLPLCMCLLDRYKNVGNVSIEDLTLDFKSMLHNRCDVTVPRYLALYDGPWNCSVDR